MKKTPLQDTAQMKENVRSREGDLRWSDIEQQKKKTLLYLNDKLSCVPANEPNTPTVIFTPSRY